jgi:hypothetical protein
VPSTWFHWRLHPLLSRRPGPSRVGHSGCRIPVAGCDGARCNRGWCCRAGRWRTRGPTRSGGRLLCRRSMLLNRHDGASPPAGVERANPPGTPWVTIPIPEPTGLRLIAGSAPRLSSVGWSARDWCCARPMAAPLCGSLRRGNRSDVRSGHERAGSHSHDERWPDVPDLGRPDWIQLL